MNNNTRKFAQEEVSDLQYFCAMNDAASVKEVLSDNTVDAKWVTDSRVLPRASALHIASRVGDIELMKLIIPHSEVNQVDQWGFTPLHYATAAKQKEVVLFLLSQGASAIIESKNGSTAKDLAEKLNLADIIDALTSKINLEKDPTHPKFRDWLNHLGAGEYLTRFIDAGYDLPFIVKHGLTEEDLDCVGIPKDKMGIRRKIIKQYEIDKFYVAKEEEEAEEDEDEEGEEEEEEEDEDDDEVEDED